MSTIRSWSGDGLSASTLTTSSTGTGDTAFTSLNGGGTFSVTADGTRSPQITFPTSSAAHQLRWNALGNLTTFAVRRYFSVGSVPSATWGLFQGLNSGGSELFRVEFNSSGLLRFRSGSAAVYSPSTSAISANTVYRVEVSGDSSGAATVALYAGDNTTPLLMSSATVTAGLLDEVRFGHNTAQATSGETADDLAVANTNGFIGPAATIPPFTGVIRSWSGDGLSAGSASVASVGTGDSAFTTVGTDLLIETLGLRSPRIIWPNSATTSNVRWNSLGNLSTFAGVFYFGIKTSLPTTSWGLMAGYDSGGTELWRIEVSGSGAIRLRNAATTTFTYTASGSIAHDTLYRVEYNQAAAGQLELRICRGDYTTLVWSGTGTVPTTMLDEVRYGANASQTAERYMDDFRLANIAGWLGPITDGGAEPGAIGTIRSWSGDGLSAGTLTTSSTGTGDTAFTTVTNSTFTITTDGMRSPQVHWPETAGAHQIRWNNLGGLTHWSVRRYFLVTAVPAVTWSLLAGYTGAGGDIFRVEVSATGLLRLRNATSATYVASSVPLQSSTVYRLEVLGDSSTGSATIRLYHGDYTTILLEGSGSIEANMLDEVRFGHVSSVAVPGQYGDDFAVSSGTSWVGPKEDGGSEPIPAIVKAWSGDGLSAGTLTTSSAGTGDTAFTTVSGSLLISDTGYRAPVIALPDTSGIKRVHWWPIFTSASDTYAVRWYMTFGGYSPSEIYLANGRASGDRWSVRMSASGMLRLRDDVAAVVRWSGGIAMPLNVRVRLELVCNGSSLSLKVYRSDYDIVLDSGSGTFSDAAIDEVRFGFSSSVASTGITYDDLAVSSAPLEIGAAVAPPPAYTHFRKSGSGEWIPQEVTIL